MQTKSSVHTKKLVQMAILVAVMLLFNYTPIGFLKIGAVEITFMCLPIAVGAIMLGPVAGGVLGGLFGVLSFAQCFGQSAFGVFMLSLNPVLTAIVCILPRILCGVLSGLLFAALRKIDRTRVVSYFAASLATALLNTLFFMASIFLLFWQNDSFLTQMNAWEMPTDSIWMFFLAFVGLNGLVEAIANFALGGAIAKALDRFVMREEQADFSPVSPVFASEPIVEGAVVEVPADLASEPQTAETVEAQTAEGIESEESEELVPTTVTLEGRQFTVQYKKSFLAKLIGAKAETKAYYAALANELCSYAGVKGKASWDYDSYGKGREQLAKLAVRGKTLCLYLAIPFAELADTKYHVEEISAKKFAKVPTMLRIRSDRALKWAKELIAQTMARFAITQGEAVNTVSAEDYPDATLAELIERGLVKYAVTAEAGGEVPMFDAAEVTVMMRTHVTVDEAHALITDDAAETLVEVEEEAPARGKPGRKFAVNIDTIAQHFGAGETVDLAVLKAKKLVPKKENAVKILARGFLDHALFVHADSFSADAIKMIVLTGGKAILTHKK